jgi:uncharacterized membrane protein (DUF2068 family)
MDWNRRHCARRGHVLYEPSEPEFLERIRVTTPHGAAWRCLRCGDFAIDVPRASGPAMNAPMVLRGKALRSQWILRMLAIERVFRFLLFALAAFAIWKFESSQVAISRLFEQDVTILKPVAQHWGYDLDHSSILETIRKTFQYKRSTLDLAIILVAAYAVVELIEAIGLWLGKRWGEYFAVVATAAFLPLEVYEISNHATKFKIATLALNVLAVIYLLLSKRLFGLRGGKKAAEAVMHSASLLEVATAAAAPGEPPVVAADLSPSNSGSTASKG